jgi:hypothetical protein
MSIQSAGASNDPGVPGKVAYTILEACAASGLSRSMLYLEIKIGNLVARKAGARTIIEDVELRRYIANLPTMHEVG